MMSCHYGYQKSAMNIMNSLCMENISVRVTISKYKDIVTLCHISV